MPRADLRVAVVRDALKHWDRVLSGTSTPDLHSSLAADDVSCPMLPCSHLAWTALDHGRRALARAVASLDSASDPDVQVVLSDLRLALVLASHALAVLAPSRDVRTLYGLRIAWTALGGQGARGGGPRDPGIKELAPFVSPIAADEVARLLVQRGFLASPRWTDVSSVRVAGVLISDHVADPVLYADTARFLWTVTAEDAPLRDDLVTSAEIVRLALDRAVGLWATRCLAPSSPASPTSEGPLGAWDQAIHRV